jgi:antitoxin StbD
MGPSKVVKISDFRKNPIKAVKSASGNAIAVTRREKVVFYCIPTKLYENILLVLEENENKTAIKNTNT